MTMLCTGDKNMVLDTETQMAIIMFITMVVSGLLSWYYWNQMFGDSTPKERESYYSYSSYKDYLKEHGR